MKKAVVVTFLLAINALVIMCGLKVRDNLQTTSYVIDTQKFTNLFVHINHSLKSINKTNEVSIKKEVSLSLKNPVKRKVVIESRISKTNWVSLFNQIKLPTEDVIIEIANTTSPVIRKNKKKALQEKIERIKNEDRISTAFSAPERSKTKTEVKVSQVDDLEFYDYSNPKKKDPPEAKKSNPYQVALKSLIKKKNLLAMNFKKKKKFKDSNPVPSDRENRENNNRQESGILPSSMPSPRLHKYKTFESDYSLSVYSANILRMTTRDYSGFDLNFLDDENDAKKDYGSGVISFSTIMNDNMMIRRGEISSIHHYPTAMDFVLEAGEISMSAPLFKRKEFDIFLKENNVKGLGGHVLVELDEKTEDADLSADTKYERKLFLNKNMKVVSREDSDFNYILFLGVSSGNTIIYFRTLTNDIVSKIIYVKDETIYFEPNLYTEVVKDEFSIYEDNLLGKDLTQLNVHSKEIENFSSNYNVENLSFNRLRLKKAIYPTGTRKYQEYKHLKESIFVGRWNSNYVDLPSEDYMRLILKQFNQTNISGSCLVQINLTKPAKEFSYNGLAKDGMYVKAIILDKNGEFYDDLSLESKKVFLMGEKQGIINFKVKYTDNSIDYLQSYCSENTYLVEQL